MGKVTQWRPRARAVPNRDKQNERMMNKGWILGILTAAAVLNDDEEFNLSNERLQKFIIDCDVLMYSMNQKLDDWKRITSEMQRLAGLRLNLRDGETPMDGRFAIVDEQAPAQDEWEG